MKNLKKLLKILISMLVLLLMFLIYSYFLPLGNKIAKNVTQESIISIKLGMNENEVKKILGNPLSINIDKYTTPPIKVLHYAKTGLFGSEIGIQITNNKVELVRIESFDLGIYECSDKYCKVIDEDRFNTLIPKKDGSIPLNIKLMLLFEFIIGVLLLKWMKVF